MSERFPEQDHSAVQDDPELQRFIATGDWTGAELYEAEQLAALLRQQAADSEESAQ